jgi:hypothetical protein
MVQGEPMKMRQMSYVMLGHLLLGGALGSDEVVPVALERQGKQVIFRAGDQEVARYQAEPGELPRADITEVYRRGGYLHPLFTPKGHLVTDDYPTNHVHHHGVWMPWTKTKFQGREPDFWNMGKGGARVEFVAVDQMDVEGGVAKLTVRHRFVDLGVEPPVTVLNEQWVVTVRAFGGEQPRHVIDLVSTQTCATTEALKLPMYHYGGFGFRGRREWDGVGNVRFLTAEGETDRVKANETRGEWCWIGGAVEGGVAGVTVLCHRDNFRFPQPMRLHPKEPFFCYAPQQLGDMEITPEQPYVSRYRLMITDGEVKATTADEWWQEWE